MADPYDDFYVTYPESPLSQPPTSGNWPHYDPYQQYPTREYGTYKTPATLGNIGGEEPGEAGEAAARVGLGTGKSLLEAAMSKTYELPANITPYMMGPRQYEYSPFVGGPQFQQTQVGTWQGPQFQSQFQKVDPNAALANYQRMNLPNAQQLMGGDYEALQQQLMIPGQQEATRGYEESLQQLRDVMGARGMYGSSVMGNQMVDLGGQYQQALAANAAQAAAQRYGMQQQDLAALNEFQLARTGLGVGQEQFATGQAQDVYQQNVERMMQQQMEANKAGLAQEQISLDAAKAQAAHGIATAGIESNVAQDVYRAGAEQTNRYQDWLNQQTQFQMGQDESQRQWSNQQVQDQFNYAMMQQQWQQQIQEMLMNQALALAGQGAPLASAQMAAQSQIEAAQQQSKAAETAALYGAMGSVGGAVAPTIMDWASDFDWGSLFA